MAAVRPLKVILVCRHAKMNRRRERMGSRPLVIGSTKVPQAWFDVFYTCVIPDDAETITVNQTINAWDYKNLYFHLDKGVTGDVVLSQSRNWKEKDIQIFMSMRASTPDMMHYLTADLRLDVQQLAPKQRSIDGGRAESFIFINMESPDLTRALSRNCTQVKVNIVFPRNLEKFDSIEVQSTFGGSISVRTEDLQLRNKLTLSTTKGDVSVQDIRVKRETRLKTSNGKVVADNLGAGRSIEIEATGGADIELTGDNDELDANISTSSGKSIVLLKSIRHSVVFTTTRLVITPLKGI
ncbi:hypothetical protein BGW38_001574 [Lunasporangiospora selenospora]|uniref:DUF4097 domain-containing protein n=1 Tax=Lunasporangiospora selenospora TaxID=979761 RepID=A0A9P6KI54_9FUNG|nr:hypothetical protein BGW38_001574 [Lunasporangiospora selenospora]